MTSLRGRIAALAALVALLAITVCAWVGSRTADQGVVDQRIRTGIEEAADLRHALERAGADLAHEIDDYANWSELYEALPELDPAWTRINLAPGRGPGGVVQVMVVVRDGRVLGRYRHPGQRTTGPSPEDPAPDAELTALVEAEAGHGLAVLAGRPALYAAVPIRPSDRGGTPAGTLIGLAYLGPAMLERIRLGGWRLTLAALPGEAATAPVATRDGDSVTVRARLAARGGAFAVDLVEELSHGRLLALRANRAIILAGLATALVATLIGVALGWRWVRPLTLLAAACRRRAVDGEAPLPAVRGLPEAEAIQDALAALVEAERRNREALAAALDRETTANLVHARFLAQLGHEFGQPIRALIATIDRLDAGGGRLPPEDLAHAREVALSLEERFQEVLGLAAEVREPGGRERDVGEYLAGVADLLAPTAARRGLRIDTAARCARAVIDPRLLTPILVNLAANAIRATASGGVRLLADTATDGGTRWTVADTGPGIEAGLARRIEDACARGEVLPGTAGIGLGLALALTNARALGGRLRLARNGADGAAFELFLPRTEPGLGTGVHHRRVAGASNRG